jgi:hypothetical protein
MQTRQWWIAVVLLGILGFLLFSRRPEAAAQPGMPVIGKFQIATFPGRAPQFAFDAQGPVGCYLVDTATGELWVLSPPAGDQKQSWKKIVDAVR